jgi:hypothetical protein
MTRTSRFIGLALLLLVVYCTLGAVVYFVSLLALQNGKLVELPWIVSAQKSLYRGGMISVSNWLAIPGCITPDPDLIYKPSNGSCRFDDIEFKTTLSFTDEGRNTGTKPAGTGIAVIGDSHAMGWGVNDHETFSAQLQKLAKRPVFNLAVASYGTSRELIRLEKSGVLDKVDTIIIQYCNNDKSENLKFDTASRQELAEKIFGQNKAAPPQPAKLQYIGKGYGLTLAAPFRSLAERLRRKNFEPHYQAFMPVLEKHQSALQNKRVIVFYSNPYGQKYRNFPSGQDSRLPNVFFVDLDLPFSNYRKLDNHLTPEGHQIAAERLLKYMQSLP